MASIKSTAADRRREERERIERAVRELATSEGWPRWVEVRSRFHDYSLHNTFLIAMQAPHASRVAGYKTWLSLGRQVKRGEKGIRRIAEARAVRRHARLPRRVRRLRHGARMVRHRRHPDR